MHNTRLIKELSSSSYFICFLGVHVFAEPNFSTDDIQEHDLFTDQIGSQTYTEKFLFATI